MKNAIMACSWAIGFVFAVVTACAAQADDNEMLTSAEINKLISGNTLSGVFGDEDTRYAQRNHHNGVAVVHAEGSPVRLIPWFVKQPDAYCEDWGKDGVLCYGMSRNANTGQTYLVYPDGKIAEMNVREGLHSISFE